MAEKNIMMPAVTRSPLNRFLVLAGMLMLVILVAAAYWRWGGDRFTQWKSKKSNQQTYTLANGAPLSPGDVPFLERMDHEQTRIVAQASKSVVAIKSMGHHRVKTYPASGAHPTTIQVPKTSYGSGTIITHEGHVLTNYHVINGFSEFLMEFIDGTRCFARKIGSDPAHDLAVLRLRTSLKIHPLPFGNSQKVQRGQMVLSFNNAYGMGLSVTRAIVSVDKENIPSVGWRMRTDGSVHPGHSGGPLLNIVGEIVGINTNSFGGNSDFNLHNSAQNIGFAIPSSTARDSFKHTLNHSSLILDGLGIEILGIFSDSRDKYLNYLNAPAHRHCIIKHVFPGSFADKAGLVQGDVILQINGHEIYHVSDMASQIEKRPTDNLIRLTLWRGRRGNASSGQKEVELRWVATPERPLPQQATHTTYNIEALGVELEELTLEEELQHDMRGFKITHIAHRGSMSMRFKRGDIITNINGIDLVNEESLDALHVSGKGRSVNAFIVIFCRRGEFHEEEVYVDSMY